MKFVKLFVVSTGGLIVLALLALFVVGRRPDAGRVAGAVEIAAPPARVMPWLTEPARLRLWVSLLREVQGDTTAAAAGRRQVWMMDDGQSGAIAMSATLTMLAPPDSLRLHLSVPGLVEGDQLYTLTDLGGRTRLEVTGRYRHPNPVVALLEPLATPESVRKLRGDLERLATVVAETERATPEAADSTGAATPAVR